ncbi:MAG: Ig-like domain-containing protein, partial [Gemmatimonadota bacterium]
MTPKRTTRIARTRVRVLSLMLLASSAMGGCGSPDGPPDRTVNEPPLLRITLDISGTSIASVVAQASATDFDTITVSLQVAGDTASGTMEIPAGSNRVLTIRAYDAAGVATHRGQTTLTVNEGTNPAVTVVLEPLTGQQEIVAIVGQVFVTIVGPSMLGVDHSDTLVAIVTDVNGDTLTDRVEWGSLTPRVAKVDTAGIVTALDTGQARIVALYGGVGAEHTISVMTGAQLAGAWIEDGFKNWFAGSYGYYGPGLFLSTASFQHSSPWTNAGMAQNSAIPRPPLVNETTDLVYRNLAEAWNLSYRAIANAADGLAMLDAYEAAGTITPIVARPYRAYGLFTEGLAYGNVAVLYDRGVIVSEVDDPASAELSGYGVVLDTALALLDRVIAIADSGSFTISTAWIPYAHGTSAELLSRVAHSMKARLRAAVARDPADRAAVDWAAVLAD